MGFNIRNLIKEIVKKFTSDADVKEYADGQMHDLVMFYRIVWRLKGIVEIMMFPEKLAPYAMFGVLFVMLHGTPSEERVKKFLETVKL